MFKRTPESLSGRSWELILGGGDFRGGLRVGVELRILKVVHGENLDRGKRGRAVVEKHVGDLSAVAFRHQNPLRAPASRGRHPDQRARHRENRAVRAQNPERGATGREAPVAEHGGEENGDREIERHGFVRRERVAKSDLAARLRLPVFVQGLEVLPQCVEAGTGPKAEVLSELNRSAVRRALVGSEFRCRELHIASGKVAGRFGEEKRRSDLCRRAFERAGLRDGSRRRFFPSFGCKREAGLRARRLGET